MVVVNTPENLDPKIVYLKFQKPVKSFLDLLDKFASPNRNLGIKRNNYYLFTLDAVYNIPADKVTKEYKFFMTLCKKAAARYYTYIMFVL
jgi:hypothetical protein